MDVVGSYTAGGNYGVLTGMDPAADWVGSSLGYAVEFSRTDNEKIVCQNNRGFISATELTVVVRAKYAGAASGDEYTLWDMWASGDFHSLLRYDHNAGVIEAFVYETDARGGGYAGTSGFADGDWHTVAMVYTGTALLVYLDGIASATSNAASGALNQGEPGAVIPYFGNAQSKPTSDEYQGLIGDVALWGRGLIASEMEQDHYDPWGLITEPTKTYLFLQAAAAGHPARRRMGGIPFAASPTPQGVQVW